MTLLHVNLLVITNFSYDETQLPHPWYFVISVLQYIEIISELGGGLLEFFLGGGFIDRGVYTLWQQTAAVFVGVLQSISTKTILASKVPLKELILTEH